MITKALTAIPTTPSLPEPNSTATSTTTKGSYSSHVGLSANEISARVLASSPAVTFVVFDYYTPSSPSVPSSNGHPWPYHLLPPTHFFVFQRSTADKFGQYIRGEEEWHQIDWSNNGTYDITLLNQSHALMHCTRDYCLFHVFDTPASTEPPPKLLTDWAYLLALDTWLLLDTRYRSCRSLDGPAVGIYSFQLLWCDI
jgi:hypothetical protein